MMAALDLIDWAQLPAATQPIARMLTDGYAQTEISKTLGMSEEKVGSLVRELRKAMIDQALTHADKLDTRLRDHLSSIASAAGGPTGKRRTA